MIHRPSISIKDNQNWLLSYTDLFLLVLSFFVLRFSVLKYNIVPDQYKEEINALIEAEQKLYFKVAPVESDNSTISIQTSIGSEWFTDLGLSTRGEREISNLGKKIDESQKIATLKLHTIKGSDQTQTNKKIVLLINNLKSMGLSSLKIEQTLKESETCGTSQDESNLACLVLAF